jgi:hypothetical protein
MKARLGRSDRGEPLMQLAAGRWWFGTPPNGWPLIEHRTWMSSHVWTCWIRLPFRRELELQGRETSIVQ